MYEKDRRTTFIFFYVLFAVFGTVGNLLVCWVLGAKKHRKDSDVFIISLAVADLLVSLTSPVTYIAFPNYYGISSEHNDEYVWYHINNYLNRISGSVASWTMVSIAVERHRAIANPLRSRISKTTKGVAICCVWVLSFASYMPVYLYTYSVLRVSLKIILYYGLVWVCLSTVIPLVVIIVLYSKCTRALRAASKTRRRLSRHHVENTRAVKMFLIVVASFFLCTMPIMVLVNVLVFRRIKSVAELRMFEFITEGALVLVLLNSCINPMIYARMHQDINAFVRKNCRRVKRAFVRDNVHPSSSETSAVV